jgi:hypothetical protein
MKQQEGAGSQTRAFSVVRQLEKIIDSHRFIEFAADKYVW